MTGFTEIHDNIASPEIFKLVTDEIHKGIWSFSNRSSGSDMNASFGANDYQVSLNAAIAQDRFNEFNVIFNLWHSINNHVDIEDNYKNRLHRVFFNANYPLSDQRLHQDNEATFSKDITMVYFAHDEWDLSWGGELLLYDVAKTKVIEGSPPVPNRLVIFPSYLPHRGVPVSRISPKMRVSIAFQCKFDNTI